MKTSLQLLHVLITIVSAFVSAANVRAQGTAFTYQGRLADGSGAANGIYDLRFAIYDLDSGGSVVGGPMTNAAVAVSNGVFTVTLDPGANVFPGADRWLDIGVRSNGAGGFIPLSPRQKLTPTPYAITAGSVTGVVPSGGVAGTYSSAVTFDNAANQFTGSFNGNGSGLSNVNALTLGGLTPSALWKLDGNNVAPGQFLGSTNPQPLEIRVNGQKAMRYEPTFDTPNVVGGWSGNSVLPGIPGATIGGGGSSVPFNGFPQPNVVTSNGHYATISGGYNNTVQGYGGVIGGGSVNSVLGDFGFIGGGQFHTIDLNAGYSVIGGGYQNTIQTNSGSAFIGGGAYNAVQHDNYNAVIAGGYQNLIQSSNYQAAIVGGFQNVIQSTYSPAFIGGGYFNQISSGGAAAVIVGGFQNTNNTANSFIGGGNNNVIDLNVNNAAIVAGSGNSIQFGSGYSFVGAGDRNLIQTNSGFSVIAGGQGNSIATNAAWATIGGGTGNSNSGRYATIAGGLNNSAAGFQTTIGGGVVNSISTNTSFSTIGGGQGNVVSPNTSGIFIGGGSRNVVGSFTIQGTIAGGWSNSIVFDLNQPTIAGGFANSIRNGGDYSFIGGGALNTNSGFVSLIAGGQDNTIGPLADHSVIAGGGNNRITGSLPFPVYATISGGQSNSIQTNAIFSTIAGGFGNTVRSNAQYAAIPGGFSNSVAGAYSLASGNRASALHDGTFVWADANGTNFSSSASNQFLIRASGGVGINKTNPATALDVNGIVTAAGFSGGGSALNSVNAATLGGLASSGFWQTGGNAGTTAGVHFLGTSDYQPLEFRVENVRALRIEPLGFPGTPNILGGQGSFVAPGIQGNFIGNSSGDAGSNFITAVNFNVIGGGYGNRVTGGFDNFIGGGQFNNIATADRAGVIGGGSDNLVTGSYATVPGGMNNTAAGDKSFAAGNRARANHHGSFVWADSQAADFESTANDQFLVRATGGVGIGTAPAAALHVLAESASVGNNTAAFQAPNLGPNVSHLHWGLTGDWYIRSATNTGKVILQDSGGNVGIGATNPTNKLHVLGGATFASGFGGANQAVVWVPGNASWSFTSDRNAKERFAAVDAQSVLEKVSRLPIAEWSYIGYEQRHIGPTAQDFHEQFPLNENDKALNEADLHGVALAAIQGLNQKHEAELSAKNTRIADLEQRLEKLENLISKSTQVR